MSARRRLALVFLLAPLACTTKGSNYPYLPTTGGAGSGGTGTVMPMGNVTVTITAPADGTTVPASTVLNVTATVTDDGTDLIDTSSVKVTLTPMLSTAAVSTGQLASTGTAGTFSGTISIGDIPSGSYTLAVTAQSVTGVMGQDSKTLSVSGGPTLIVKSPTEGQAVNRSVSIEILVDTGAPAPSARLAGTDVTLSGPMQNGMYDVYTATATFDPSIPTGTTNAFGALTGPQLLDVKETAGSTSEVQRIFIIDTTGPTISATTPGPGLIVGGVITVSAKVTDDSGVLDSSVMAIIGDDHGTPVFTLQLEPQGGGVYSTLFDTQNLTQCKPAPSTDLCIVYPTVSFRATDAAGNESSLGYEFAVDNIPPLSDLSPPKMRQMRLSALGYECSALFDPLGLQQEIGDMPKDGYVVPQVFDLRAKIEDEGNDRATGLKVVPIAGVDPNDTNVYILTDTSKPLVVDSDGDGYCDEINPNLVPTTGPLTQSDQVLKIRLAGVKPAGNADFFKPDYDTADLMLPSPCVVGSDTTPPKRLCALDGFEQPTIAVGYAGDLPAIWGIEPIDSARCLGNQFDTKANNVPDGAWICMAVGSADLAGSKGVSTPMRVYVDYNDQGAYNTTGPGQPPACTGTYDPTSKEDAVGTCQTVGFKDVDMGRTELYCAPGAC